MPIPIILCGKLEAIGKLFKEAVEPDFEVVHFIDSPESGLADIPLLLKGSAPTGAGAGADGKIGSGNLAETPKAVVVNSAYDDAWIESLRKELAGTDKKLPLLKPEARNAGHAGHMGGAPSVDQAKMVAERAVKVLKKLAGERKLGGAEDGVFVY